MPPPNPYYQGPPSVHFDGQRFHLPGHTQDKSRRDLLRWRFGPARARWPKHAPSPCADAPARYGAPEPSGEVWSR